MADTCSGDEPLDQLVERAEQGDAVAQNQLATKYFEGELTEWLAG